MRARVCVLPCLLVCAWVWVCVCVGLCVCVHGEDESSATQRQKSRDSSASSRVYFRCVAVTILDSGFCDEHDKKLQSRKKIKGIQNFVKG